MSAPEAQQQKILINWRDGARNPEQAAGAAEGIQIAGYEPLADLLEAFLANGGKLWLCPACVKAKGIDETALLDGVEVAGAPRTMAYLASGAQVLA